MGKKFLNASNGRIQFGAGIVVGPGEVIELDDKLVEKKKAAIDAMVESGQLSATKVVKEVIEEKEKPKNKKK